MHNIRRCAGSRGEEYEECRRKLWLQMSKNCLGVPMIENPIRRRLLHTLILVMQLQLYNGQPSTQ